MTQEDKRNDLKRYYCVACGFQLDDVDFKRQFKSINNGLDSFAILEYSCASCGIIGEHHVMVSDYWELLPVNEVNGKRSWVDLFHMFVKGLCKPEDACNIRKNRNSSGAITLEEHKEFVEYLDKCTSALQELKDETENRKDS